MNHISLFSGIGGFDLAAEWMEWNNVAHCEWNPFGQNILKYYWQKSISYEDITKTDFTIHRGNIDIVTGGFPCQPYSVAGKRKGKEDERHLWPEMLRAIREIQPSWVVGENVRGLTNWNGGLVFDEVQAELETEGYKILPFLLPACAVDAPHRRDRIWFIAYSHSAGLQKKRTEQQTTRTEQYGELDRITSPDASSEPSSISIQQRRQKQTENLDVGRENEGESSANARCFRSPNNSVEREYSEPRTDRNERPTDVYQTKSIISPNPDSRRQSSEEYRKEESGWFTEKSIPRDWQNFPTQSPIRMGNDGFSTESLRQRIREDSMGVISEKEIDKILSSADTEWRNESIKAGGNAIVPQVAFQIFKAIEAYENLTLMIDNNK